MRAYTPPPPAAAARAVQRDGVTVLVGADSEPVGPRAVHPRRCAAGRRLVAATSLRGLVLAVAALAAISVVGDFMYGRPLDPATVFDMVRVRPRTW